MVMLISHMHRFGRRFTIDLFDDAGGTKKPLNESTDYGHPLVVQHASDPIAIGPIRVSSGLRVLKTLRRTRGRRREWA